jgi:zinc transporter, ZIP family
MSPLVLALLAGLGSGLALVVGAAVAWFVAVPRWLVAGVMAFGAGVLISALAFDLVAEATTAGSFATSMAGFLSGAVAYVLLNALLDRLGSRHRRGTGGGAGTGLGIALGALLDGVPETAVQGVALAADGVLPLAVLVAVVLSNLPEGLSSTADLKREGRSARYVFGVWVTITVACALSAVGGYTLLGDASGGVQSFVTAIAAGAILAMLADTMLPEAFRRTGRWTGLVTAVGFFASYGVHTLGG